MYTEANDGATKTCGLSMMMVLCDGVGGTVGVPLDGCSSGWVWLLVAAALSFSVTLSSAICALYNGGLCVGQQHGSKFRLCCRVS